MTGGPSPSRSKAMLVPSLEVTVAMKFSFRFVHAISVRAFFVSRGHARYPTREGHLPALPLFRRLHDAVHRHQLRRDHFSYGDLLRPPGYASSVRSIWQRS